MDTLVCVKDFEEEAFKILDLNAKNYIWSGGDDETTMFRNKTAYSRWIIHPRVLRNVEARKLSRTVFGMEVSFPLGFAPSAFQRLSHPDGEVANARAAAQMGTIYIQAYFATSSVEEVAAAAPNGRNWQQIFAHKDRSITVELIRRAEKAAFEALVWTVDALFVGKRRANRRRPLVIPKHLNLGNVHEKEKSLGLTNLHELLDLGVTWEFLEFLKKTTKLPIVVKGILTSEDARIALTAGASAIYVSNHGGRQLDSGFATMDALGAIVKEVNKECPIFVDGGIRTGTDIFKALALGATMVFVGRPLLWGLAVDGESGVKKVLEILRDELDLTMCLSGTPTLDDINDEYISASYMSSKL